MLRLRAHSFGRSVSLLPAAACCFAVSLTAQLAGAQTAVEPTFTVQRFQAAPGPRNFLVTRGARVDGQKAWSFGGFAHYGYKPFVISTCGEPTDGSPGMTEDGVCTREGALQPRDVKVVENMLTLDLMGSFTPMPMIQIGGRLPVTWLKGQGITKNGKTDEDGLQAVGIGDFELEGKARLYGDVKAPLVLGVALSATAPLGHLTAKEKYIGDKTPTIGGRVIVDGAQGPFSYALNLGGIYRGSGKIGATTTVGPEARYSVAAAFRVSPVLQLMADLFGATRFSGALGQNPMELLVGARIQPVTWPLAVTLGAGSGISQGVGSPRIRGLLGVNYIAESHDDDGDGIVTHLDQCPTEPEDKDGYEDSDGCPDKDNDLDTIPDANDKCPMQAEDADGFEDMDGCPEVDNDKDGLADTADQCPIEAETKNGYKDEDGCPDESDVDNDGVPDARDQCKNEAEDTDGFEDTDGCPDPDNDKDGVLDEQDECIDEPETANGFQDEDGCPDEDPKKKRK